MSAAAPASVLPATRPGTLRALVAAARPATLSAAVVPVLVGSALALERHAWAPGAALAALLGAVAIQIGTNLFNDWADFARGADTPERLGPARATALGWLSARQVLAATVASFAVATAAGVFLVWHGGFAVVVIGVASILAGLAYTGGPWPLAYLGLGEPFVLVFFGVVATAGTTYVQSGTVHPGDLRAGAMLGLVCTAILVVNNLRDRHTDTRAGKRTLVVRLGERFGRIEHAGLLASAFLVLLVDVWLSGAPGRLFGLVALPLAWREIGAVHRKDGAALNPHLGGAARVELVLGLGYALGVLLGRPG